MKKLMKLFKAWRSRRVRKRITLATANILEHIKRLTPPAALLLLILLPLGSHESPTVSRPWFSADQLFLATSDALIAMHARVQVCDLREACEAVSQEALMVPIDDAQARCMAVIFGESGVKPRAEHLNRNGTRDHGLMQVNDIHFRERRFHKTSEWQRFCWQRGWTDDPTLKLDIRRNVAFGCHLWRMELRQGKRSYQWAKAARPDQRRFYALLRHKLSE